MMSKMTTATFAVGTEVTVRELTETEYKRPPVYAVGATGTVDSIRGTYERPSETTESRLYSVRFDSGDIWGDEAEQNASVYVDIWEESLESTESTSEQQTAAKSNQ